MTYEKYYHFVMKVYVNVCLCYVSVNRYFQLFLQFVGKIFLLIVFKKF